MNTDNLFDIKVNAMIQSKGDYDCMIQSNGDYNCLIQSNCDWCAEHSKNIGDKFCSDECGDKFYSNFVAKLVDEEEEEDEDKAEAEDEDESEYYCEIESECEEEVPLREMNDVQIEKYVERIGQCPRDECLEWAMLYTGGDILRYSYCKFIQWGIEDQTVSNITITRATFDDTTFTNYVFDNVTFEECVFRDVVLNNTTFKNCAFIECEMDSSMSLDNSCKLIKHNEYDHYYALYDYEEDYDDEDDRQVYEDLY